MKCEKERVTHFLSNQMTDSERNEFEGHLAECASCQQELKEGREFLNLMSQMREPEPSADMELRFHGMLDAYKQSALKGGSAWRNVVNRLQLLWSFQPRAQLTYSIILLLSGIVVGYLLQSNNSNNSKEQIADLSTKVEDMRQLMMMSMLDNPSASERLKAVSYTEEISNVNSEVIDALFTTLNEDPNVNVRLVTLDALSKYSSNPKVREGLIQSIVQQESPLLQSALADVMIRLQEKRSVKAFRQLLQQGGEDNPVKSKIEKAILQLSL
jgi:hypothetical protein